MKNEELIIKAYLKRKSKESRRPKRHPFNEKYYEQLMNPFYKRIHTFI